MKEEPENHSEYKENILIKYSIQHFPVGTLTKKWEVKEMSIIVGNPVLK